MDGFVDLRDYLAIIRRRWISLVAVTLAAVLAATVVTLATTRQYTATTRLFFAVNGTASAADLVLGSSFAQQQMVSFAQVATSPLVLDSVVADLGLPSSSAELARSVAATVPPDTAILEIAVDDPDPAQAARIANAIGDRLTTVAGDLSPALPNGARTVKATTLTPAVVPLEASSPDVPRHLLLALVLGLILGIGAALLREAADTAVRGEADVRRVTERPVLGVVGATDTLIGHPIIVQAEPHGPVAEAVRRLRTNLQFVDVGHGSRSIVVTSALGGEGKSTLAANLAVSLGDTGVKVILVDADLRRPSVARYTGLEGSVGLTSVLIGQASLDDVVQPVGGGTLDVLPAGRVPPNPSELLGSAAMAVLLEQLREVYDVVLLDSPPVLPVADAVALSAVADGALVVVGTDRIHRPQLGATLTALESAGTHVLGLVVNKIAPRGDRNDRYGYGYAYAGPEREPVGSGARAGAAHRGG